MTSPSQEKELIVVWFSCGVSSAVAAKKTIELYGNSEKHLIRIINNPVMEEDEDNKRFLKDVEKWIGKKIEFAVNPKFKSCSCVEVWNKRKFMSSPYGAPCTVELKKRARQIFENHNNVNWNVLGFTYDEIERYKRFILTERTNVLPILIDEKITKEDCFNILKKSGIEIPRIYKFGFPNANCIGCVKATSPTYWNLVRKIYPKVFEERANQSREIGAKLVRHKGKRIFLDELPKNAKGRDLKKYDIECGIFCEEK